MDLDQLHTFLEVVRLKSFSKAAQTCYRTQPAISAQIRQLEQELNARLFDRLGTKIELTPAGRIFAEYARQILELRREAQEKINELEHNPRGELVIAASEANCLYVLAGVLRTFKERFPNVQLQLERSHTDRVLEVVLDNRADFGVAQLPVADRRLQTVAFYRDQLCAVLPPGHLLAREPFVSPAHLKGAELLLPRYGRTRRLLDDWLEPVLEDITVSMELESTEMVKRFVEVGLGIGFLPASHCRYEVEAKRLITVPLGPEPVLRHLALVYRKDRPLSKAALGFIEAVLELKSENLP